MPFVWCTHDMAQIGRSRSDLDLQLRVTQMPWLLLWLNVPPYESD